jgi:hypothetical protein
MEHETAQELFGGECHLALLTAVGVVLPPEADLSISDRQKPMVGDGDAVGVARQVVQYILWAAKDVSPRAT